MADDQVLDMDDGPGVGRDLLKALPPCAVVVDRGEPPASERGMISWPMSDDDRRRFAAGMARIGSRWRGMTAATLREYLDDLGEETTRLGLDLIDKQNECMIVRDSIDG